MLLLLLQNEITEKAAQFNSGPSAALMFLQMIVALGFVVGLAYLILRVLLPRTMQRMNVSRLKAADSTMGMMRLVDTLALKERQQLHIVEITGRYFAIATTDSSATTITEIQAAPVEAIEAQFHQQVVAATLAKANTPWLTQFRNQITQFFKK
ncbi:MAG: flagellar biosynthetic protein FliO [Blastocatellia bacterium]